MTFPNLLNLQVLLYFVGFLVVHRSLGSRICALIRSDFNVTRSSIFISEGFSFINLVNDSSNTEIQDRLRNETTYILVDESCNLVICSETKLARDCRVHSEGLSTLSHVSHDQLSFNCTCTQICGCQDALNLGRNGCARAYLNDRGCNKCDSFYTDMKVGEALYLPQEMSKEVSSIFVKEGCNLNVYDNEELQGNTSAVQQTTENWNTPIRSYTCSCDVDYIPSSPSGAVPSLKPSKYPSMINIPSSVEEIQSMLKGEFAGHEGLKAALKSQRGRRSYKNAYILLLGTTGAGKSSTINFLLDNPNLSQDGVKFSATKSFQEYRIPVSVNELGIRNSELRIIDTPGFGNTQRLESEAKSLASLADYLDRHDELQNRIPNVVLIFHNFLGNQFHDEDSTFVQMIQAFDSFRERLVDTTYSSVIFVLTHFNSEVRTIKRDPRRRLAEFKKVIQQHSKFPLPVILTVAENRADQERFPMRNGNHKLPNGEFYPKNLFDKITEITGACEDAIGEAVIRSGFQNPHSLNITLIENMPLDPPNHQIQKFMEVLKPGQNQVKQTEVSRRLKNAFNQLSPKLKENFLDCLHNLQKSFHLMNIRSVAEVPKTPTGILKLYSNLRKNDAVLFTLKQAFGIEPPVFQEDIIVGNSYNIFTDKPLAMTPFMLGNLENSDIGYLLPVNITCKIKRKSCGIFQVLQSKKEYVQERMNRLKIPQNMSLGMFTGEIRSGYNILSKYNDSRRNYKSPITGVKEIRVFSLKLDSNLNLTDEFKGRVAKLVPFNSSNLESVQQWESFFNEYGTHFVQSVFGGGEILIEMDTQKPFRTEFMDFLNVFSQFEENISMGALKNISLNVEGRNNSITLRGGNSQFQRVELTTLSSNVAADILEKWKSSLLVNPLILTTDMKMIPISHLVKRVTHSLMPDVEKAVRFFFNLSVEQFNPIIEGQLALHGKDSGNSKPFSEAHIFEFLQKWTQRFNISPNRSLDLLLNIPGGIAQDSTDWEKCQNRRIRTWNRRNHQNNLEIGLNSSNAIPTEDYWVYGSNEDSDSEWSRGLSTVEWMWILLFVIMGILGTLLVLKLYLLGIPRNSSVQVLETSEAGTDDQDATAEEVLELVEKLGSVLRAEHFTRGKQIGSGAFGNVYLASRKNSITYNKDFTLSTVNDASYEESTFIWKEPIEKLIADKAAVNEFLNEVKTMERLGENENIVKFVGCIIDKELETSKAVIIMEHCELGDLKQYLQENKSNFLDYSLSSSATIIETDSGYSSLQVNFSKRSFETADLFKWTFQIASGLHFLTSKKIVHRDIAARNVLLTKNFVAKIADFGFSRFMNNAKQYYRPVLMKSENVNGTVTERTLKLPIRWLSEDFFNHFKFSDDSDIWAFGVTVWEIFSLGSEPYGDEFDCTSLLPIFLASGKRLAKPAEASVDMYKIMLKCWAKQGKDRPRFSELKALLMNQQLCVNQSPN